ncbi:hypothetical protein GYMLUDRAFT_35514 [Collybiopsis luxurians FD-317 M1]|nr:hypothetical protein GYMLUDRAFT_35514 [Collybiopsis luxurians FD-317 M1]
MPQSNAPNSAVLLQVNWNHYIDIAAFVILVYDYLLTFDREIECFWKWRTTGLGSRLFYMNRYLTLFGVILYIYLYLGCAPMTINYNAVEIYLEAFLFVVQIVIAILFILRMYALYGASTRVAIFLSIVGIGAVVNAVIQLFLESRDNGPNGNNDNGDLTPTEVGSLEDFSGPEALHMVYIWIGIFVFDISVFCLTCWKTLQMRRDHVHGGIGEIIMRDGLLYFVIIALINLANIFLFAFGKGFTKNLFPFLATILASVTMSRMLFNMREGQSSVDSGSGDMMNLDEGLEAESIENGIGVA